MPENLPSAPPEPTPEESEILDELEKEASLDDSILEDIPVEHSSTTAPEELPPVEEDLTWDESETPTTTPEPAVEDSYSVEDTTTEATEEGPPLLPIGEPKGLRGS